MLFHPSGAKHVTSRNIAFFATAKSGLGHLQRIGNIALALRTRGFDGKLQLFCNAGVSGLPDKVLDTFNRVVVADRERLAEAARATEVSVVVSDMMVLPNLVTVAKSRVLILRETPAEQIGRFSLEGGHKWDRVIVPNPPEHWRPHLTPGFARCCDAVGWITRSAPDTVTVGPKIKVLLATGGGGTSETRSMLYPVLADVIKKAREKVSFVLTQALGPRAGEHALADVDEVVDPGAHLDQLFHRADTVISTAGYNSVLELAATDTPTLLAAIPRSFDDQQARVRKWGALLGHGLERGQEAAAAHWLADQVAHPKRRKPVDLGPDGAIKTAELLEQMA